ncbi:nuclear transport factor 2 family protein [Cupriavidus basilensis]|uniref:nuclear transport factor 2 family protein n=1 Tax=Cupriavidus basilensis TaxID=68895 RepID=UPI0023E897BE|nr:nuclear transport factor 2 family protein [Cupriavidus basilensis]MDF3881853.1 nuclear transport factor 2 family protein [Cupriavidus basilensis]
MPNLGTSQNQKTDACVPEGVMSRLQRLADELEITQLRGRYCDLLDSQQWGPFVELFTEDGVFEGIDRAAGREEISRFFSEDVPAMAEGFWHFCTNGTVSIEGDQATGRISMLYLSVSGGKSYVSAGHYDDEMVRTVQGWRFSSRKISFYFYSELKDGFCGKPPMPLLGWPN